MLGGRDLLYGLGGHSQQVQYLGTAERSSISYSQLRPTALQKISNSRLQAHGAVKSPHRCNRCRNRPLPLDGIGMEDRSEAILGPSRWIKAVRRGPRSPSSSWSSKPEPMERACHVSTPFEPLFYSSPGQNIAGATIPRTTSKQIEAACSSSVPSDHSSSYKVRGVHAMKVPTWEMRNENVFSFFAFSEKKNSAFNFHVQFVPSY